MCAWCVVATSQYFVTLLAWRLADISWAHKTQHNRTRFPGRLVAHAVSTDML